MLEGRSKFSLQVLQLIDEVEMIAARDVSYCDLSKRDESSPYYNVPVGAVEDSG